ncbi:hypothetical protein ACFS07_13185 [Undibacterium arcticum]
MMATFFFEVMENALGSDKLALVADHAGAGTAIAPCGGDHLGKACARSFNGLSAAGQGIDAFTGNFSRSTSPSAWFRRETFFDRAREFVRRRDLLFDFRLIQQRDRAAFNGHDFLFFHVMLLVMV